MKFLKRNKSFVSDIDLFLEKFDREHPQRSASQKREEDKYRKIFAMRDRKQPQPDKRVLWERF